jgi:hypothetical protein
MHEVKMAGVQSLRKAFQHDLLMSAKHIPTSMHPEVYELDSLRMSHCSASFVLWKICGPKREEPIAVAERSEARTVFDRSEAVFASSNPALGMDV